MSDRYVVPANCAKVMPPPTGFVKTMLKAKVPGLQERVAVVNGDADVEEAVPVDVPVEDNVLVLDWDVAIADEVDWVEVAVIPVDKELLDCVKLAEEPDDTPELVLGIGKGGGLDVAMDENVADEVVEELDRLENIVVTPDGSDVGVGRLMVEVDEELDVTAV